MRKYAENFQSSEWFSRGYLPHRDGRDLIQHVTFHLADSLPKSAIDRVEAAFAGIPDGRREAERRKRLDAWMDAGHGSCVLQRPEVAEMVQASLLHFDGERYRLHAWVVMPNHVHVLFQPINDWSMAKVVSSWKKFTARKINDFGKSNRGSADLAIGVAGGGANREIGGPGGPRGPGIDHVGGGSRREAVWHREYWDRYIRNERHYADVVDYIHGNPVKAGLVERPEDWPWSSARIMLTEDGL